MPWPRIEAVDLGKSYGPVNALTGVTLRVEAGTVLGVLGHNGAGKTTLIDILATRTLPTAGRAWVCGFDVVRFGHHVRRNIGMAGQFVAVDEGMSGRDNLILIARLLGASRRAARERAVELLEAFGLTEVAGRRVGRYSGGMRRRLDLAMSLLGRPSVLFLDEPTTGLDPVSRTDLWGFVERLAAEGTTVVLTTQYLDEADRLADEIVVLAAGSVVASGTPASLKAGVGHRTATVRLADPGATLGAEAALTRLGMRPVADAAQCTLRLAVSAAGEIAVLVRALDTAGVPIVDLTVAEPTLDDVYLALYRAAWGPLWRSA
jgi:ABC-2 type transport system ATP-binding protein